MEDPPLKMEYNYLSENCGLKVSNLFFGSATFGQWDEGFPGQCDAAAAHALLDRFEAAGGNFLDTANIYAGGEAERILGLWIQKRQNRDNIVLATKARYNSQMDKVTFDNLNDNPKNPNSVGLSHKNILKSITDSLERLQTHYIDLYQIHSWDDATPIKETLLTLNDLVRAGKVRYVGGSNLTGWQLQKILDFNHFLGFDQWVTLQQQYSLIHRESELESFEVCKREGLGVLPWSPLCGGMLTNKVLASRGGPLPQGSRVAAMRNIQPFQPYVDKILQDDNFWSLLDTASTVAKEKKKSISQVALRWLLQTPPVTSVIIGAKTMEQLENNLGASSGWKLTEKQMKKLDEASAPTIGYPYDLIQHHNAGRQRCLGRQY